MYRPSWKYLSCIGTNAAGRGSLLNDANRSFGMPVGERTVLPRFIAAVGRLQNARNGRRANTARDELLPLQIGGYTSADWHPLSIARSLRFSVVDADAEPPASAADRRLGARSRDRWLHYSDGQQLDLVKYRSVFSNELISVKTEHWLSELLPKTTASYAQVRSRNFVSIAAVLGVFCY